MQRIQAKNQASPKAMQDKLSSVFEQSLTEEQKFLKGILSGEIKTYSHEEVMTDLRRVLKR